MCVRGYSVILCCVVKYLSSPSDRLFTFDVEIHRPKEARGNEKDKLPSGVKPRSNDQQTSTL